MTGDDIDIFGQVLLECSDLGSFAGCLTTNYGTYFRGRAVQSNYRIDSLGFDVVNDPIAYARNQMTVTKDSQVFLDIKLSMHDFDCAIYQVLRT